MMFVGEHVEAGLMKSLPNRWPPITADQGLIHIAGKDLTT